MNCLKITIYLSQCFLQIFAFLLSYNNSSILLYLIENNSIKKVYFNKLISGIMNDCVHS
jgi:hypothetical protein